MKKLSLALLALSLAHWPSPADATVVRWLSLLEKSEIAPVVVHGVVERIETEWEVPEAKLHTLYTVRVIEGLKGDLAAGERFVMRRGGGRLGDFQQTAPGLSNFEPGEEVVLFLEPFGPYLVEIGIGIGKYGVEQSGRDKWVTHAPKVAGLRRGDRGEAVIEEIPAMEPEALDTFLKRVRSYVRGVPAERAPEPRKGVSKKTPLGLPGAE